MNMTALLLASAVGYILGEKTKTRGRYMASRGPIRRIIDAKVDVYCNNLRKKAFGNNYGNCYVHYNELPYQPIRGTVSECAKDEESEETDGES